jgi:hypothetical protein
MASIIRTAKMHKRHHLKALDRLVEPVLVLKRASPLPQRCKMQPLVLERTICIKLRFVRTL